MKITALSTPLILAFAATAKGVPPEGFELLPANTLLEKDDIAQSTKGRWFQTSQPNTLSSFRYHYARLKKNCSFIHFGGLIINPEQKKTDKPIRIKKTSKTTLKVVDNLTKLAFADYDTTIPENTADVMRKLHWRSDVFLSRDEAIEILKRRVGKCNRFNPILLAALPPDCQIEIGRAYSVSLHVKMPEGKGITPYLTHTLRTSSCQMKGDNVWNLWWD